MSTVTIPKFSPGEAVTEQDGLIHGVSAQELQVLGEQCFEARAKAYCMLTDLVQIVVAVAGHMDTGVVC
jgi:cytidine deaminase